MDDYFLVADPSGNVFVVTESKPQVDANAADPTLTFEKNTMSTSTQSSIALMESWLKWMTQK